MPGLETSHFWTPMILCVAISSVFALLVLYYFRQQINTLDHKINSMFSLITSITNELNRLTMLQAGGDLNLEESMPTQVQQPYTSNQIEVSDEEDYEEYDDEDDEDDEDELQQDNLVESDLLSKTVLLTTEDLNLDNEEDDDEDSEEDSDDEDSDEDDKSIEDINNDFDNLKIIGEEKSIHLGEEVIDHTQGNDNDVKILDLETDNIEDLEEKMMESMIELEEIDNLPIVADNGYTSDNEDASEDFDEELTNNYSKNIEIVDYKKLPVKTLREIVVEKGLVQNASKLAKKQLLDLLEGN
jgi:hypothetical protein